MSEKTPTIKLVPDGPPLIAEPIFDTPKEGANQHGAWALFKVRLLAPYPGQGAMHNAGDEVAFFSPNEEATEKLRPYRRGSRFQLTVHKIPGSRAQRVEVVPAGGAAPVAAAADEDELFGEVPFEDRPPYGVADPNYTPVAPASASVSAPGPRRAAPAAGPTVHPYAQAILDAMEVVDQGFDMIERRFGADRKNALARTVTFEDLRTIATTLYLDRSRR